MEKLLLLHSALDTKDQFEGLCSLLKNEFEVHTLNFSGHGGKPIPVKPFTIKFFSEEVMYWLDENKIASINIAGHSSMMVIPRTSHPFESINTERLAFEIRNFIKD